MSEEVSRIPTILLVEDELEFLDAMAVVLRKAGYSVVPAANGTGAIRLLERRAFDLVIVDMILPGTSGFQVAEYVRDAYAGRVEGGSKVPILMISGFFSGPHRAYAEAIGVNSFLAKPFALAELVKEVLWLCPKKSNTPPPVGVTAGNPSPPPPSPS